MGYLSYHNIRWKVKWRRLCVLFKFLSFALFLVIIFLLFFGWTIFFPGHTGTHRVGKPSLHETGQWGTITDDNVQWWADWRKVMQTDYHQRSTTTYRGTCGFGQHWGDGCGWHRQGEPLWSPPLFVFSCAALSHCRIVRSSGVFEPLGVLTKFGKLDHFLCIYTYDTCVLNTEYSRDQYETLRVMNRIIQSIRGNGQWSA